MKVNAKSFDVYPDVKTMTSQLTNESEVATEDIDRLISQKADTAIVRQIHLQQFYTHMTTAIKRSAAKSKGGKIPKSRLETIYKRAITACKKELMESEERDQILANFNKLKDELEQQRKIKSDIEKRSHKKAGMTFAFGLMACWAQLTGFTVGIYGISDWNEMEPLTWLVQAWYLMIGSWYFLRYRHDFEYTGAYMMF